MIHVLRGRGRRVSHSTLESLLIEKKKTREVSEQTEKKKGGYEVMK